jgi:hypothetical protein
MVISFVLRWTLPALKHLTGFDIGSRGMPPKPFAYLIVRGWTRDLPNGFFDLGLNLPLSFRNSLKQRLLRDGESRNEGVSNRDMIFAVLVSDGHLGGRVKGMLNAAGYLCDRYEVVESSLRDRQIVRIIRWTLNTVHDGGGYDRGPVFAKNVL